MPRGGRRNPTQGKQYPNRSDMRQPAQAVKNQTYGERGKQLAAQSAMPLPQIPQAVQIPQQPEQGAQQVGGGIFGPSQDVIPLHATSSRPNEPITTGLPTGPGAGPEILGPGQVSP